jgi:DNA-binding MarR family transcriptional regulator
MAPSAQPESREELVRRVGVAWRELRRGASMQGLRELLYGAGSDALDIGQVDALDLLAERGACRMSELAEALRVDASTATRAVARLVEEQLVERAPAGNDRRVVVVRLTATGRRLHARMTERRRAVLGRLGDQFEDGELEQLAELLERLVTSVDLVVAESRDRRASA